MTRWMAAIALAALAAGGCSGAPSEEAEAPASPAAEQSCADDGERLELTGLCAGRAVNYLAMDASSSPQAPDGCGWQVMETQMSDGVLLYRGLKCDAGETKLEFSGGAERGELKLVSSAYLGKIDEPPAYVLVYPVKGDARQGVTARARQAIAEPAEASKCSARPARGKGWPSDALVVDVPGGETQTGPRSACGDLGVNDDLAAFWRVSQGHGWYSQMGQADMEIDPGSFTLMTKQPDGSWGAM
ncbi:hypothetical protein [Sphingomonas ursincola]|uniref:Lipoprotein n=1 Tax=Sphingomonas ursincola TaxID=56361 RepID=A0A7V8U832_9SPHN|nr:hypothetical protein [Sphingomonas ursincola]MBA1373628.1 hypothetical protein [Sphingomonas ursincola]